MNVLSSHPTTTARPPTAAPERPGNSPYLGQPRACSTTTSRLKCPHPSSPSFHLPHHHQQLQQTRHTTTTSWKGQRTLERVDRRGEGAVRRGDDDEVTWNPHAALSNSPPPFFSFSSLSFVTTQCATYTPRRLFISFTINWWRGVQPTRRVVYLFLSLSIDDTACNLHAVSSTSLFYYQLMTRHASYIPRRWFLSFTINWWRSVHPTRCVVNFSLSLSIDDAVCILHAALSISFFHYHLSGSSRLNTYIVYIVCL